MKNKIISTGISFSAHSNIDDDFDDSPKEIYGNVTIDYTSCGDMSDFIGKDGKFDKGKFLSSMAISFSKHLGSITDL